VEGFDLHLHSNASDGLFSPREVIRRAHGAGLAGVALTDHDTVSGLEEGEREAHRLGLRFVPGCEISIACESHDIHMLAYFVGAGHPSLVTLLDEICSAREARIERMVDALNRLGLPLKLADVRAVAAGSRAMGRMHVAEALYRRGFVASQREAFTALIGDGGAACVAKSTPPAAEVLELIWSTGGVPVLAHPALYRIADPEAYFREWDLGGIEVDHPSHAPAMRQALCQWAQRRGLLATAGSDWHGSENTQCYLGCCTTAAPIVDQLAAARRRIGDWQITRAPGEP
jgi:predicted metal-dependent phosphoesterase TrpH